MMHFTPVDRQSAQSHPLGAVQLIGDYGGRTYVIRQASAVVASDGALRQLAVDLDAAFDWSCPDATRVLWCVVNPWREWKWSPTIESGFWLDSRLVSRGVVAALVDAVLKGVSLRLRPG
jgi:hypothetical protein